MQRYALMTAIVRICERESNGLTFSALSGNHRAILSPGSTPISSRAFAWAIARFLICPAVHFKFFVRYRAASLWGSESIAEWIDLMKDDWFRCTWDFKTKFDKFLMCGTCRIMIALEKDKQSQDCYSQEFCSECTPPHPQNTARPSWSWPHQVFHAKTDKNS